MEKFIFLLMTFSILLALVIVLIVVLKNGEFNFSAKKDKKKDALLIQAKHRDIDK